MEITLIKKSDNKINRKTGKPIERLKVAAYARVSTDNEEQLNSYESQKKYYKEKIMSNSNWDFVGIYADEGISGTQDYKREEFMSMINDGINNKFDLLLTKSISRFARNTLDTLKYVRLLKEHNVAIFFEEEGINTLEMTGELLLAILSSVAQQESETISSHVKLGLKMKSERGELVGFNSCFGYSYDSKTNKMEIIENEAQIVKLIFKLYLEGHGCDYIANRLNEMNIPKRKSGKWSSGTVLCIIKNEKYIGDVIQGKTYTIDAITHKRQKNFGESEKWHMKDHHEAIISREDFEKACEIRKTRCGIRATGRRLGNKGKKYTFSGKIKCGFCGTSYSRRRMYSKSGGIVIWDCIRNIERGVYDCPESKAMRESIIEKAFVDAYNLLCSAKDLNIEELLITIKKAMDNNDNREKIHKFKKNKDNLIYQKNRLLDLLIRETISEDIFNEKNKQLDDKIEKVEHKIEQYTVLEEDKSKVDKGILKIKETINTKEIMSKFDEEVFETLVEYIIIGGSVDRQKDSCMIRFICKSGFDDNSCQKLTQEDFVDNQNIENGSSQNFIPVLDFYSNQKYYLFEKDNSGKLQKIMKDKVRVRLELAK